MSSIVVIPSYKSIIYFVITSFLFYFLLNNYL